MNRSSRSQSTVLLATVLAATVLACSDTPQGPVDEGGTIALEISVHLLRSDAAVSLDATLEDADVDTLIAGVNAIWAEAGIAWRVGSIVREEARNADDYELLLSGGTTALGEVLLSVVPRENTVAGRWEVFVVRDLGDVAGGVYLPSVPLIVFAELGVAGDQGPTAFGPLVLAHELGHSLGLDHVACTPDGNLMAPSCPGRDRTRLTSTQIQTARARALVGRPFQFAAAPILQ